MISESIKRYLLILYSNICLIPFFRGKITVGELLYKYLHPRNTLFSIKIGKTLISLDLKTIHSRYIFFRSYEKSEIHFFRKYIKETDFIIDVGANIGFISAIFADIADKGKVFSIEADPANYNYLIKTANSNQDIISTYQFAVSKNSNKTLSFYCDIENPMYSSLDYNSLSGNSDNIQQIQIPSISLDDFVKEYVQKEIHFIKIDVEGSEYAVVEGMVETLKKGKVKVLCEITPWLQTKAGRDIMEIFNIFEKYNYKRYIINYDGSLKFNEKVNSIEHTGATNFVFLPNE